MKPPPPGIVWLASFPKSGNTWFRAFLANLASGGQAPADINLDMSGGIASNRHEFETVTMLDSGLLSHDEIDSLRPGVYEALAAETDTQRWIKVHDAYTTADGEPLLGRNAARAAIYLVRDPRDVATSLAFHDNTSVDDAIRFMSAPESAYCDGLNGLLPQLRQKLGGWSRHVTGWLDQNDVPVHVVRYEDLIATPMQCFGAALRFVGHSATPDEIENATRNSDLAQLQKQEQQRGFRERKSKAAPFFRSGKAGGWRQALTDRQVAAIEQAHGAVMARMGYELSGR